MGPIWVLSAPDEPHVGLMNLAIRDFFVVDRWPYLGSMRVILVALVSSRVSSCCEASNPSFSYTCVIVMFPGWLSLLTSWGSLVALISLLKWRHQHISANTKTSNAIYDGFFDSKYIQIHDMMHYAGSLATRPSPIRKLGTSHIASHTRIYIYIYIYIRKTVQYRIYWTVLKRGPTHPTHATSGSATCECLAVEQVKVPNKCQKFRKKGKDDEWHYYCLI